MLDKQRRIDIPRAFHALDTSALQRLFANSSPGRTAFQLAIATAALWLVGHALHIAEWPTLSHKAPVWLGQSRPRLDVVPSPPQSQITAALPQPPANDSDAALAELYAMCPMAATVDLETARGLSPFVESAEQKGTVPLAALPVSIDALLPPYRLTADHVPQAPAEPAVPRIRYPFSVRQVDPAATKSEPLRVAQAPKTSTSSSKGDWLVDPKEWYIDEDQQQAPSATEAASEDASSSEPTAGGASDAETTPQIGPRSAQDTPPKSEPSSASETPPTSETPSTIESLDTPPPATSTELFAPPTEAAKEETLPLPNAAPKEAAPNALFPAPQSTTQPGQPNQPVDPHLELFAKNAYPSARECAQCHEDIYHEWSVSAHAYAAVSPMFHKFEQKLNDLSQGTVGYFCMRCHAPVATALCASRDEPLWNLPEVAREGITCIACHRVQYVYGKSNGERRIEPGDVFAPVLGGIGGHGVADTIHRKDEFKVKTSPDESGPGQNMHAAGIYFEPLTRSEFCTPCHQVAVYPGIKLEVVWEQYRASPACKKGIQCQDCHMGKVPGLPLGYNTGPVARLANKTVNDCRKKSNHIFFGPNYSIAHPGIFPFHLKSNRWTMQEWLCFDWRAGWGTEEFEDAVADGRTHVAFPPVWAEVDDRYDAREIIDDNLKKLNHKRDLRVEIMENGSHVEGPYFDSPPRRGRDIDVHYVVTNTNEGHNLLTASLGAQPELWANVVLVGPDGRRLWETGYLDSYADLANIHSVDVRHKRLPYDWQLFNLQTMFLITGAKGTDREFYVPVNVDIDQIPFIRPGVQPITVINHPPFIRMESQSLAPLGSRQASYRIPGELIQQPGTYRLTFRMRSRAEPMYLMRFCEATPEMMRAMNEWMIDVHPITFEFTVR